jgi:hypothetical protein
MSDATLGLPRQLAKIYRLHDVGFGRLNTPSAVTGPSLAMPKGFALGEHHVGGEEIDT